MQSFSSLVSIALRALSPSLNDPITASTCIDYLTSGLAEVMRRQPQPRFVSDEKGKLRLVLHPLTSAQILDFVAYQVRQTAGGQVRVLIHLTDALTTLASFAQNEEQRQSLIKHAQAIERTCRDTINDEQDRVDANARIARLQRALGTR